MTSIIRQIIQDAVRSSLPQVVEGGRQNVQLGDGTTPGVVVVPPTDPRYFPGAFYCFSVTGGTKTIHVVENRWPGLTYDNSPARTWVQIGYPPGSKRLAILGPVPGLTTQYSHGPMPTQAGLVQSMEITPDRIASLRLIPQGTLVVGLTPGRYVIGETVYTVEETDTAFLDVTSHLPAGPDQDKWLLVGIDTGGNAQVTAGSAFDEDDANPGSFAPDDVPANCYPLGYLRLNDDLTGFEPGDNRIIPAQGLAAVSGNVFRDDRFTLQGNLDPTKQLQFQVDGLAAATNVVLSPPPASDTITGIAATQTLTNKTLTTPTIGNLTNAQHNHQNAAGGGALDTAAIASGTFANARIAQSNVTQHEAAINHDALLNFVANEHIDHSTVSINTSEGVQGGGTIAATRSLKLDINGLTEDTTPDLDADFVATYDASGAVHKKVKPVRLLTSEVSITSTGNIDDLDFSNATLIRMNNASDATIRGLAAGVQGQRVTIVSVGAGNVFLAHQNAGSAAANRLTNTVTSANTPLFAGIGYATYEYDATSTAWRLVTHRQGAALPYTVSWTGTGSNPALGNGTLTGTYIVDGNTCKVLISLATGSTTTYGTGSWAFSLPIAGIVGSLISNIIGTATDTSAGLVYLATTAFATTSTISFVGNATGLFSATVPFTWSGTPDIDRLNVFGEYRIR